MASLFEEEEEVMPETLVGSLPATRARRSASSAVPQSGLTRVFSSGAPQPPLASLTSPFEDTRGLEPIPASAPDRARLPAVRLRGTTVGQALLRVLIEARERDESIDAAADALPISGPATEYNLRVASDVGMPDDPSAEKAFGQSGDPLAGPWSPDCDFPAPDTQSVLSSIGVSVFVVTQTSTSATGDTAATTPTSMEVVPAQLPAAALKSGDSAPSAEHADEAAHRAPAASLTASEHGTASRAAGSGVSTASAEASAATAEASAGPWTVGGETVVMRVRLPDKSIPQHAGEVRSFARSASALTLTVERPTKDGLRLAARYTVTIEATPTPPGGSEAGMTDAPPASELASSLLSGALVMASPVA